MMKRFFRLTVVLPVLATTGIVLAGIGWLVQGKEAGDALFQALHVLSAGGDYEESAKWAGNYWIGVARWFGLAFFVLTALKAFRLLLARQWRELRAQLAPRDLVFVGDHPAFATMTRLLATRRSILWVAGPTAQPQDGVHVVDRAWQPPLARRFRLGRAAAIVVAFREDDLRGLTVARALAAVSSEAEIALLSASLSAPSGLALASDLDRVRILSPEQLAIRSVHEAYPPFDSAQRSGQRRIHALMLGCGRTGERVIADLLLSSLTTFLDKPRVTVVDPRADTLEFGLSVRAPELDRSMELTFVAPKASGDPHALPLEELRAASSVDPFTCAYVCLDGDQASLSAALALDEVARREGWPLDLIFVRQRDGDATAAGGIEAFGRLVPIGRGDQLADALGLLGGQPDRLARSLHAAYRASAPADAAANVAWEMLPENLREANRQAFAHLPAKIASAGVPVDQWLAARRRRDPDADPPAFPDLDRDPALLDRLAVLEHERWMAERRLAGWQYAPTRDDVRRRHPDLVPFEALSARSQSYDSVMIRTLAAAVAGAAR